MNTCKTCKMWNGGPAPDPDPAWDIPNGFGTCLHERVGLHGKMSMDSLSFDGYAEHRSGLAITGPDFGCVHHAENT